MKPNSPHPAFPASPRPLVGAVSEPARGGAVIEILLPKAGAGGSPELISIEITAEEFASCRHAAERDGIALDHWLVHQLRRRMSAPNPPFRLEAIRPSSPPGG